MRFIPVMILKIKIKALIQLNKQKKMFKKINKYNKKKLNLGVDKQIKKKLKLQKCKNLKILININLISQIGT